MDNIRYGDKVRVFCGFYEGLRGRAVSFFDGCYTLDTIVPDQGERFQALSSPYVNVYANCVEVIRD